MIRFLEYKQNNEVLFTDGLNEFLRSNLMDTESITSVSYQKYIQDGNPSSSVLITTKENPENAQTQNRKELIFFEFNEHELGVPEGVDFYKVLNNQLSEILNVEDDVLSVEYSRYFYQMKIYTSVLILLNVAL
mgnify:CR=1 FL=1